MSRIVASVTIGGFSDDSETLTCDAFVDTNSPLMVLPITWRNRLDTFKSTRIIEWKTATGETISGEVCGPVRIQIEGFRPIYSEVSFVDMMSGDSDSKPLIGHIVLAQSQAAVDMLGHRLVPIKHMDLKSIPIPAAPALQTKSSPAAAE